MDIVSIDNQIKRLLSGFSYDYQSKEKKQLPVTITFSTRAVRYGGNDAGEAEVAINIVRYKVTPAEKNVVALDPEIPDYFKAIVSGLVELFQKRVLESGKAMRLRTVELTSETGSWKSQIVFDLPITVASQYRQKEMKDLTYVVPRLEPQS